MNYTQFPRLKVTLLVILVIVLPNILAGQKLSDLSVPFIQNYSTDDYDGGIQNWEIGQSADGRLYVANNRGLLEFDAKNWHTYRLQYGTKLRSVYINEERIYTGSQNDFGYLKPNAQGSLIYISLADSLKAAERNFDETWKIFGDSEHIYFCTFSNIYIYNNEDIKVIKPSHPLEISFWLAHELITQQWGLGLTRLVNDRLELIPNGEFFSDKRVSAIIPNNKNEWLITTFNDGIYTYNNGEIIQKSFKDLPNNLTINAAKRLRTGELAIATQNSGIYILSLQDGQLKHIDMSKGIMDNTINALFEDKEGSLWLSMNNGISRIDINSPISFIDERVGLLGAGYASLRHGNQYYLGTNNGLFSMGDGQIEKIKNSDGQVYAIQFLKNRLLVGHHEGPMEVKDNSVKKLNQEKGAWLFTPYPDNSNRLITGTYLGINTMNLNNDQFQKYEGFDESSRVMAFDDKTLWITQGYKGAFKVTFDQQMGKIISSEIYNSNKGFPSDFLINVFEINGKLIFTSESGFYQYNLQDDGFRPNIAFNTAIGKESTIVDMEEDVLGNIYYIEASGIGKISRNGLGSYEKVTTSFGKVGKLWNDDLGNITVIDTDQILIGARKGFILYEPRKEQLQTKEFNIAFSSIRLLNKTNELIYDGHGKDSLPAPFKYLNNSLAFRFYAPHFESSDNLYFQVKLENYDSDWSDWTSTDFKEYTNLREGDYTFKVRAKNIYGEISEHTSYTFTITPPIYRSKGAYAFYSFGTILLAFLGFKTLDYRHKEETKALESSKNKELDRKNKEIQSITAKSEQEIGELKNAKLQTELNLKSRALTSSAMNLIQKNELLSQVKQTLKTMDKSNWSVQSNTDINRLVKSIDKDLASGEEWAQFEENFDQVHGNFIRRLKEAYPKLTPQEIKFSAYLRMNLNSKEIAHLLNISVRGVEIGRYRVRKKLALERKDNLSDFLMRF